MVGAYLQPLGEGSLVDVHGSSGNLLLKGSPLADCIGFVDGTVRGMCRPGRYQRAVYNGHNRIHSLKFQAISLPNGLTTNLFGPW